MIREIVLDTETTGLSPQDGDRIVEIGAVELLNQVPTGKTFHVYLNPERDMPKEAEAVHGLSSAFLKDKPLFKTVAQDFLTFIEGAQLVIHNATFDMNFINFELQKIGLQAVDMGRVLDTLAIAKKKHPMASNSLDALCKRYGVDNSKRTKHGALLDAELLAEVYLELSGGKQAMFNLTSLAKRAERGAVASPRGQARQRENPLPQRLTPAEQEAHAKLVADLGEKSLWLKLNSETIH
jgi:DNA polymerase III subunit epsilon